MKLLLAATLASVIAGPCMAADTGDQVPGDALTPGVQEPRVPDTLKPNADQRIRDQGIKSQESTEGKGPARESEPISPKTDKK
jgi:hypothetical protein